MIIRAGDWRIQLAWFAGRSEKCFLTPSPYVTFQKLGVLRRVQLGVCFVKGDIWVSVMAGKPRKSA